MVEVLEFAFQNPTHFLGCLIFLLCVCWAIANFTPVRIERNTYEVSSDLVKEQLEKEFKGDTQ